MKKKKTNKGTKALQKFVDGIAKQAAETINAAHLDALIWGVGYIRITGEGEISHVPTKKIFEEAPPPGIERHYIEDK